MLSITEYKNERWPMTSSDGRKSLWSSIKNWVRFLKGTTRTHGLTNWLIVLSLLGVVYLNSGFLVDEAVKLSAPIYRGVNGITN